MSRFAEVFRFEVRYLLRRPSTWIYLLFLLGLALMSPVNIDRGDSTHWNAPLNMAGMSLFIGLVGALITAALFGDAGSRDVLSGMHPLFYAAPLRRHEYLGGRFAGALAVNALMLAAVPLGLAATTQMGLDPALLGPFRAASYVRPYLFFLLPNLLINAAVLFGLTVLSRRAFPSYLGAIGLFMGYVVAIGATSQMDHSPFAALVDPSGFAAASELFSDWTPVEQNENLVGLTGMLLWNRVLWTAIALAVLAFTWARFRFAHHAAGGRRRAARDDAADGGAAPAAAPADAPAVPRSFGWATWAHQTLAIAVRSFQEILVSRDFLAVAVGLLIFVFAFGPEMMSDDRFGVPAWPLTQYVSGFLRSFFVAVVISLLTAFYAGELVWRERDARVAEIVDAAPVPDGVRFVSKFLALALILVALQSVLMLGGMLLQAFLGWRQLEPGLYLRVLFGMQLMDYLLLAAVAMLVHVVVNQKYLGHLLVLVFYLGTAYPGLLGLKHNLLVYGSDPGWTYSDMAGFGPFLGPYAWFKAYWAAWALLLAVVASLFWVRGTEHGARRRLRVARRRFTRPLAGGAAVAAVLIAGLGGFVFYNTSVLSDHRSDDETAALRIGYEVRYKRFENIPQPWQTGATLNVEIYPDRQRVELRGSYRLVNRTGQPLDSIHLSFFPDIRERTIGFDRAARLALGDEARGYRIYVLEQALQPGDSMQMRFEMVYAQQGFPDRQVKTSVVGNGTFFGQRWLPFIGYQRDFEVAATETRREFGLARRDYRPSIHDLGARRVARSSSNSDWISLETVVGTAAGQVAVAPGTLRRQWTENGRAYFHYRTDAPTLNFFGILSADYAVHRSSWNGVAIEVLHHPSHDFNLERLVGAVRASLDYYARAFGPYPHRQIRLVEFPRYAVFARAYPGQIVFSEGSSLMAKVDDEGGQFDSPFMVTAHEVAHQWWGHQVMGADVQGSQMLSETLAQYSALMVMERTHAPGAVHEFLRTMQIEYLNRRGTHANPEVPLMLTGDHDYLHYRKGAVVMYALRDYIGEAQVNTALRRLLERFRFGGPPYPTSLDLYRELQAVTPDSLQYLLHDLVASITLWDLRANDARAVPAGGGAYRVTIELDASKVRADSVGNDSVIPMNDLIEIGVFAEARDGEELGRPLYLRKHRIRSGQRSITVTVPGRPARAGIDPYHKLITRHKEQLDAKLTNVEVGG